MAVLFPVELQVMALQAEGLSLPLTQAELLAVGHVLAVHQVGLLAVGHVLVELRVVGHVLVVHLVELLMAVLAQAVLRAAHLRLHHGSHLGQ